MPPEDSDEDVPAAVPLSNSAQQRDSSEVEEESQSPTPVLLVTGFLGAGKTTLLNFILTEKHGYRCAVILNEFGDSAGIERAILNDSQGDQAFELQDWVELSNGCACCSVKNDFIKALEGLMAKSGRYDYVLIETTGLASPGPIASALWTDAELESAVCLDAVVTVVDAANISRQLAADREQGTVCEAQEQVAYADVILCNKIDRLRDDEERARVLGMLRGINEDAAIHCTTRCQLELQKILHRGTYSREPDLVLRGSMSHGEAPVEGGSRHPEKRAANAAPAQVHWHDTRIVTIRLAEHGFVDIERLRHWLDTILWEKEAGADILRLKGVVNVPNTRERKVIQAVHEVYDLHDARPWDGSRPEANQIVLIGRGLDQEQLRLSFKRCLI